VSYASSRSDEAWASLGPTSLLLVRIAETGMSRSQNDIDTMTAHNDDDTASHPRKTESP
jgi:hypothetical protein